MILTKPPKIKLIALRELYYGGKQIIKDQTFDATSEHARLFIAVRSAKLYDGHEKRTYKRRDMVPEK